MSARALAGVRTEPPAPVLASRVWFGWLVGWAAFFTLTLSPLLVLHSAFRPTAATLRRWMRPWARGILAVAGVRLSVEHRAPLPSGPVVFVSNHVNSYDVPVTMLALDRPFLYVARHELRAWPVVGWVLEKSACLFIARDNPRQAVADLRRVAGRIHDGESALLFPEGGRSYGHGLQPFMRGPFVLAIEAGVPVVPVTIVGNAGVLDRRRQSARPGVVRVVVGEAVPTAGLARADAAALQDRVRAVLHAALAAHGEPAEIPASG